MQIRIALAALVAALFLPAFAHAEPAAQDARDSGFKYVPPEGHCLLEETNPHDAIGVKFFTTMARSLNGTLIAASVECGLRAIIRKGEGPALTDYAIFYIVQSGNSPPSADTQSERRAFCAAIRRAAGSVDSNFVKDFANAKAKDMRVDLTITGTKMIGVMGEDDHGCYSVMLAGLKEPDGKAVIMSAVMASTVAHRKRLVLALYRQYNGPETTLASIAQAKAALAAFDKVNP